MTENQINFNLQTPDEVRKVVAKSHSSSGTQAEGVINIAEFFTLLYQMLRADCPQVILVPSFPKYLRPNTVENQKTMENPTEKFADTITYELVRREPATMGGNKQPFGTGFKELTPHIRKTVGNTDGTQTNVYGQNFDNLIRFTVWTLTSIEAESLTNWFEQYLRDRRTLFRNLGLGEILFWFRGEEKEVPILDNGLERRDITFYVRTEELSIEQESVLKNLEIQLGTRTT